MRIQRGYKFELRINTQERAYLTDCAGTARFEWNWGLAGRITRYQKNVDSPRGSGRLSIICLGLQRGGKERMDNPSRTIETK